MSTTPDPNAQCSGCKQPLAATPGPCVQAGTDVWHVSCFKCVTCSVPIQTGFAPHPEGPQCVSCAEKRAREAKQAAVQAAKITCGGCNEQITSGQVLQMFGKTFHPHCFKCHRCASVLTSRVLEVEGQPTCAACVEAIKAERDRAHAQAQVQAQTEQASQSQQRAQVDAPVCTACGQRVAAGEAVTTVNTRLLHAKCFLCAMCSKPITATYVMNNAGAPCCQPCVQQHKEAQAQAQAQASAAVVVCRACGTNVRGSYMEFNGAKFCEPCATRIQKGELKCEGLFNCAKCSKAVSTGNFRKVGERLFHLECFKCTTCQQALGETGFKSKDGLLYCIPHFPTEKLFSNCICSGCKKSISQGTVVELGDDGEWHQECFVCAKCDQPLSDVYMMHQKRPFCRPCFFKVAGQS